MKRLLLLFLISICAVVLATVFTACNQDDTHTATLENPCYDLTLSYDGENSLSLVEDLTFSATCDLQDVKLHLYPNAFSSSVSSAPISENEWAKVSAFGKIDVLSVKIDRQNRDFEIRGQDDSILSVPVAAKEGDTINLVISAEVAIPNCIARFGKNDKTVNLTGFYPVLCAMKDGAWLEDGYTSTGDPFCLDAADYYVTIDYPSSFVAATPEICVTEESDGIKTSVITAEKIRDFALVLSSYFKTSSAVTQNGVTVNYFYFGEDDALSVAVKAIETFSSAFGEYPYKTYTLVRAPLPAGGMEYGGLSIVTPTASNETVIHETAHQWWYNVVGNDQIRESWLDEGLTEFSTAYFYALTDREDLYSDFMSDAYSSYSKWKSSAESLSMTSSVYEVTPTDYVLTSYVKGAILFDTLRSVIGDEKLLSALSAYYRDNAYEIATVDDLISAFDAASPKSGKIILTFLNGKEIIS